MHSANRSNSGMCKCEARKLMTGDNNQNEYTQLVTMLNFTSHYTHLWHYALIHKYSKFSSVGPCKEYSTHGTIRLFDARFREYILGFSYDIDQGDIHSSVSYVSLSLDHDEYRQFRYTFSNYERINKSSNSLRNPDLARYALDTPEEIGKFCESLKFWHIPGYTPLIPTLFDINPKEFYRLYGMNERRKNYKRQRRERGRCAIL